MGCCTGIHGPCKPPQSGNWLCSDLDLTPLFRCSAPALPKKRGGLLTHRGAFFALRWRRVVWALVPSGLVI